MVSPGRAVSLGYRNPYTTDGVALLYRHQTAVLLSDSPTVATLFNSDCLSKGFISRYTPIGGWGLQHSNFCRGPNSACNARDPRLCVLKSDFLCLPHPSSGPVAPSSPRLTSYLFIYKRRCLCFRACFRCSRRSPRIPFDWPTLGHVPPPEPITGF